MHAVVEGFSYCISRQAPYAHTTGTAKSMASMRSSMPPWPGRIVAESLTQAHRFMRDSTRSLNCSAMLTNRRRQNDVPPADISSARQRGVRR